MTARLSTQERDYMTRRLRLLAEEDRLPAAVDIAREFQVTASQLAALGKLAFPVRVDPARRRALTPQTKAELAPVVAELAAASKTDEKIAEELDLSADQVLKVRRSAGIAPGRPRPRTYKLQKPLVHMADCPACGLSVDILRHGGLEPHRRLGPSRHGIRIAVDCDGPARHWVRRTEGES